MYILNIKELFKKFGNSLTHTNIMCVRDEYDLYDKSGILLCLKDEKCNVLRADDKDVVLENKYGDEPVIFKLSLEEFDVAAHMA